MTPRRSATPSRRSPGSSGRRPLGNPRWHRPRRRPGRGRAARPGVRPVRTTARPAAVVPTLAGSVLPAAGVVFEDGSRMNGDLVVLAEDRVSAGQPCRQRGGEDRRVRRCRGRPGLPFLRAGYLGHRRRGVVRRRAAGTVGGLRFRCGRLRCTAHGGGSRREAGCSRLTRGSSPAPRPRAVIPALWQDGHARTATTAASAAHKANGKDQHEQRSQPRSGHRNKPHRDPRYRCRGVQHRLLHRPHAAQAGGQRGGNPQGLCRGRRIQVQIGLREPCLGQDREKGAQGLRRTNVLRGRFPAGRHAQRRQGVRGPRRRAGRGR